MISATSSGSFDKIKKFLHFLQSDDLYSEFDHCGRLGVDYLSSATPIDTGLTAHSWVYTVSHNGDRHSITWYNTHRHENVNIAIILQYGHGTGTGGYVEGIDYINPALRPLFDKMVDDLWREVQHA